MAFQPKLTTKSGMPSGMTTSTAHMRRPGKVGALDEPRQHRAQRGAQHRDHDGEADRVAHQLCGQAAEEQRLQRGPARLEGLDEQEDQRGHHRQGDEDGQATQERRPAAAVPAQAVVMQVVAEPGPLAVPATPCPCLACRGRRHGWPPPRRPPCPLPAPSPRLARSRPVPRRLLGPRDGAAVLIAATTPAERSQQLRLLEQLDRLGARAQLRDGDRVRLELGERASRAASWSRPTRWGTRSCRCGR